VIIQAVNDELPTLIHNDPADVEFGGSVILTGDQLKAADDDNFDDEVYFLLLSRPKRGALQLMTSDRYHGELDPLSAKAVWIQVFI